MVHGTRSPFSSPVLRLFLVLGMAAGFVSETSHARSIDLKSETFATYFGGTYMLSNVSDYAFGQSGGTGVTTDQSTRSNFGGEFGLVFTTGNGGIRLSAEYLQAKTLSGVIGSNSGGTPYYSLESKLSAIVPMLSAEAPIWKSPTSRIQVGGGVGYAFVSLEQAYTMTAAGSSALGVSDFVEKAATQSFAWKLFMSAETTFVDMTSLTLEAGYRNIKVGSIQSSKDTTAISGHQTIGSDLQNMDGSKRAFDLGGGYVSVYFRFYL